MPTGEAWRGAILKIFFPSYASLIVGSIKRPTSKILFFPVKHFYEIALRVLPIISPTRYILYKLNIYFYKEYFTRRPMIYSPRDIKTSAQIYKTRLWPYRIIVKKIFAMRFVAIPNYFSVKERITRGCRVRERILKFCSCRRLVTPRITSPLILAALPGVHGPRGKLACILGAVYRHCGRTIYTRASACTPS